MECKVSKGSAEMEERDEGGTQAFNYLESEVTHVTLTLGLLF